MGVPSEMCLSPAGLGRAKEMNNTGHKFWEGGKRKAVLLFFRFNTEGEKEKKKEEKVHKKCTKSKDKEGESSFFLLTFSFAFL
jgi:hypothetical protein